MAVAAEANTLQSGNLSGCDLAASAISLVDTVSGLLNCVLKPLLTIEVLGPKARAAAGVADPVTGTRCPAVASSTFRLRKRSQGATHGLVRGGDLRSESRRIGPFHSVNVGKVRFD
jgi:hypothetical protein